MLRCFKRRRDAANAQDVERRRQLQAFDAYLDEYKRDLIELIHARPIDKPANEPLAPWLCYHYPLVFDRDELRSRGIDLLLYAEKDSFYWHTLDAARCTRAFFEHFFSLGLEDKVACFKRYDLGPGWKDRESWFHMVFDEDPGVTDDDYDHAYAQIFS